MIIIFCPFSLTIFVISWHEVDRKVDYWLALAVSKIMLSCIKKLCILQSTTINTEKYKIDKKLCFHLQQPGVESWICSPGPPNAPTATLECCRHIVGRTDLWGLIPLYLLKKNFAQLWCYLKLVIKIGKQWCFIAVESRKAKPLRKWKLSEKK